MELGLRVNIIEDRHQFILHHQVMRRITDEKAAVKIVEETKKRFLDLAVVSWDKGAHSQQNQRDFKELLDLVLLPKKGRLTETVRRRESPPEFKLLGRQHSRWNPPSTLSKYTGWINDRFMESFGSNVMSPWLWSPKKSTGWGPSCANRKNNSSVVNEVHTKAA